MYGEMAYFFGGVTADDSFSKLLNIYNHSTNKWTLLTSTTARAFAAPLVVRTYMMFMNGLLEGGAPSSVIDAYETLEGELTEVTGKADAFRTETEERLAELEAKQARNNAAWRDIERRRGDAARLILYVSLELGGGVDDAPERLAQAEAIHDAEAWRLGPNASMREQLYWAKEQAQRALGSDG